MGWADWVDLMLQVDRRVCTRLERFGHEVPNFQFIGLVESNPVGTLQESSK